VSRRDFQALKKCNKYTLLVHGKDKCLPLALYSCHYKQNKKIVCSTMTFFYITFILMLFPFVRMNQNSYELFFIHFTVKLAQICTSQKCSTVRLTIRTQEWCCFFFSEPNKDSDYSMNQSHILHIVFDFPPQTFPLIIGLKNIELNKYNFPKHKTSFTN